MIDSSDHSSIRLFSIGVPVIASLNGARQPPRALVDLRLVVLDELRLVEDQAGPRGARVGVDVEPEQRVGGDDDVGAGDGLGQVAAATAPACRVIGATAQLGREPRGLGRPVRRRRWSARRPGTGGASGSRLRGRGRSAPASASVLPSPMSSARMPPRPCSHRNASHANPSRW